jgi:hypothetical protein
MPSRNVSVDCLFVLCTFVSAFAQTTTSATRVLSPPEGASQMNSTDARSRCAAALSEPEGDASDPLAGANNVAAPELGRLAQRFLNDRLAVWQPRLKLEDWRVSVVMTRRSELAPNTLGGIRWDKPKKSAVIWVLDASDYRLPLREMLGDMELTIVHELVHLDLASLRRGEAGRGGQEQAVSGIAEAMLDLARKKQ